MGLALPEVEEGTAYGSPALKLRGQLLGCIPTNRDAEPNSFVVRVDFAQRDELIAAEPDVYYLKPHYVNYPCVLARVRRLSDGALKELLETSWRFVQTTGRASKAGSQSRRRRR